MPFRIIPDLRERPEDSVQSARAKGRYVFDDDPPRIDLGDEAVELEPEAAALPGETGSLSRIADVLAGEASADDIDGNSICREALDCECLDVVIDGDSGPVLAQYLARELLDLAEGDGLEVTRLLQAQRETADA